MDLSKNLEPHQIRQLVEEWVAGVTLGDLAIRYLGYSASDSLGTRAAAVHRLLKQLFDQAGLSHLPLAAIRKNRLLVDSLFSPSGREQVQPIEQPHRPAGSRKILVLSDLHIPFHNMEMIDWAVTTERDADELVLLGDLWDMYAASRFVKNRRIDVLEELEIGYSMLVDWLQQFERVVVVVGNHDTRPARLVMREHVEVAPLLLSPLEYVKYRMVSDGQAHLLERLVEPRYLVRGSHPSYPVVTDFLYVVGDAVLGHFEVSRKGPGMTAYRLAMEWLPTWGPLVGVEQARVLVQGHVHRLSKGIYGKTTIIESGCCAHVLDYVTQYPLSYAPPSIGYVVLYQDDGVTDINRSGYMAYDLYRS